jgi:hypothetical protein
MKLARQRWVHLFPAESTSFGTQIRCTVALESVTAEGETAQLIVENIP